ncbi:PREDICTED: UDP-glucose 4-epimerase-like isoform X2 [Priapulus caudatus]|uniref:UDP-glucose 4-epimerase n=1 Tax=Priapulus caudatus TaxID=37621 RepID=A0ABM1DXG7_PRICU|nr:PREDICTED: UDP-glucose 4-epimerase-like isoform X2 [Priapulus caudatus]
MGETEYVFVTGGAGYIGSHTVLELLNKGYQPVVMDNFSNSCKESLVRVEQLTGKEIIFFKADILDKSALRKVFSKYNFLCVIHFAGLKAVGESSTIPMSYYRVNVGGTINLVEVMKEFGVHNLVFSSSATVYGEPQYLPLDECHAVGSCTNPYGKTKYFIEEILKDLHHAEPNWNVFLLRYFNPVGSHASGRIGEDPLDAPNNLMPYVSQVAIGRRPLLSVFGDDYPTTDGTGVRDYIHVVDLAVGHVACLKKLHDNPGLKIYNLGTGQGYSVLEMVKAFEAASGQKVPYKVVGRRSGDVASVYAATTLAYEELGWKAERGLAEMCTDLWRWQSSNPKGFASTVD